MYNKNDKVKWNWGNGEAEGKIKEKHTSEVSRTIKGSKVTKKGTDDNPAYVIEQSDGTTVIKKHSEVKKA